MDDEEFLAAPIPFDANGDGKEDLILCSRQGYVLTVGRDGELMEDYTMRIPPASIPRDWNTGVNKVNENENEQRNGNLFSRLYPPFSLLRLLSMTVR